MAFPSTLPPAAVVSEYPNKNHYDVFHPFPRLPSELRLKIWTHYLDDATPQMYRFTLHYPRRLARWDAALNFLEAGDQLFLQPIKCISEDSGPAEKCSLQPLRESTTTAVLPL